MQISSTYFWYKIIGFVYSLSYLTDYEGGNNTSDGLSDASLTAPSELTLAPGDITNVDRPYNAMSGILILCVLHPIVGQIQ